MFKLLSILMILPILICSHVEATIDLFSEASMIYIYNNGQQIEITDEEMKDFENIFCESISSARQMPALGVAIDEYVKEDMKEGYWVKFIFEKTHIKSEMPFDELLIKIEKNSSGFNIIRGNQGVYDGRCYYLDLDGNLDKVYDYIEKLVNKDSVKTEVELENQEIKETVIVCEDEQDEKNKDKPKKNQVIEIEVSTQPNEENEISEESGKSQKELLEVLNS